jgi:hypothetical protein
MKRYLPVVALAASGTLCAPAAVPARAAEIPIDISGFVNAPWTFSTCGVGFILNGDTFPTGSQNFGVPFAIPTGPNNVWLGAVAADCGAGTLRLTIPVDVPGVRSVFTLLNTFWGEQGPSAYLFVTSGQNGRYSAELEAHAFALFGSV